MAKEVCAECRREPGKYFMIHPELGRPVRVCGACKKVLAERIAQKQAWLLGNIR